MQLVATTYIQQLENIILQRDNARPHTPAVTTKFFRASQVTVPLWPDRPFYPSNTEHVGDMINRRFVSVIMDLHHIRYDVQIAQEDIGHLIPSMPRRVQKCINLREAPTN